MLSHIAIFVKNLDRMEEFYTNMFNMKRVWKEEKIKTYLTSGERDILGLLTHKIKVERKKTKVLETLEKESKTTENFFHYGFVYTKKQEYYKIIKKLEKEGHFIYVKDKMSRDGSMSSYVYDPEKNIIQICYVPKSYFQV